MPCRYCGLPSTLTLALTQVGLSSVAPSVAHLAGKVGYPHLAITPQPKIIGTLMSVSIYHAHTQQPYDPIMLLWQNTFFIHIDFHMVYPMSWSMSCMTPTYAHGKQMALRLTYVRKYNNIMHKSASITLIICVSPWLRGWGDPYGHV